MERDTLVTRSSITVLIVTTAGLACAHQPQHLDLRPLPAITIYINAQTGDILHLSKTSRSQSPAGTLPDKEPVLDISAGDFCDDGGASNSGLIAVDLPGNPPLPEEGTALFDWFDTPFDFSIDCLTVTYAVAHPDTDTNSDGFGDGVDGLAIQYTFYDAFDGTPNNFINTAVPLLELRLNNIPGLTPDTPAGFLSTYELTIDLADNGSALEFGDTDSKSSADIFVPALGLASDTDNDGRSNWGYELRFFQPGTIDTDGDTLINGDLADANTTAVLLAAISPGQAAFNGSFWEWLSTDPDFEHPNAYSVRFHNTLAGTVTPLVGPFVNDFGIDCSDNTNEDTHAGFAFRAFRNLDPNTCANPVDFNNDDNLDFFDINTFITAFTKNDPLVDFNTDGNWDFFDINFFITNFTAGCP